MVSAGPGAYQVLLNDGDGGFVDAAPVAVDAEIAAFAVADVDGDGAVDRLDVTHTSSSSSSLLLARGDGAGDFGAQEVAAADLAYELATALDVFDVDGDGDQDVVVGGLGSDIYRNDGTGVFTRTGGPGGLCGSSSTGGHYSMVVTELTHADINRDGDVDIVMAGLCEPTEILSEHPAVWLRSNDGTGRFPSGSGSSGAYGGAYAGVSVKDTDEDGHLTSSSATPRRRR